MVYIPRNWHFSCFLFWNVLIENFREALHLFLYKKASIAILTCHDILQIFFTLAASLCFSMTKVIFICMYILQGGWIFFCFYIFDKRSSFQAAEQGSEIVVKQVRFLLWIIWLLLSLIVSVCQAVSRLNSVSATASPYPNR